MPKKVLSLAQKILAISKAAAVVERGGTNEEDRYKYARVGDILDVIEPLLHKHKLILYADFGCPDCSSVSSFKRTETPRGSIVDIVLRWVLLDTETNTSEQFLIPGSGWGKDEKGTYKALTGSRKYAIVFIFGLRVADEPEAPHDYPVDREESKDKAKEVARKKLEEKAQSTDPKVRAIAEEGLRKLTDGDAQ